MTDVERLLIKENVKLRGVAISLADALRDLIMGLGPDIQQIDQVDRAKRLCRLIIRDLSAEYPPDHPAPGQLGSVPL